MAVGNEICRIKARKPRSLDKNKIAIEEGFRVGEIQDVFQPPNQ